jgi:anti-sigma-K factor RskA
MKCEEVLDLIPSYALGALEPRESRRVEQHIAECPECEVALQEALEVSTNLSKAFAAVQPSAHVRTALMNEVRGRAEKSNRSWAFLGRFRWQGGLTAGLGVATMALLVLSIVQVVRIDSMNNDVAALQTRLSISDENMDTLNEAVAQQRSLAYTLAIPGTHVSMGEGSGGRGVLMSVADGSWGLLVSIGLRELPPDRAYQVWLTGNANRESAGMFSVDDTGWGQVTLKPHSTLNAFNSVGVTVEPAEGSPAPTGPMVLKAEMTE